MSRRKKFNEKRRFRHALKRPWTQDGAFYPALSSKPRKNVNGHEQSFWRCREQRKLY